MTTLLAIAVFVGILAYAVMRNPKPPKVQNVDELQRLGYSAKEAKREARAQRNEHRASTRTVLDGIKAGSQAARTIKRLLK
jgi:hypothetical protein